MPAVTAAAVPKTEVLKILGGTVTQGMDNYIFGKGQQRACVSASITTDCCTLAIGSGGDGRNDIPVYTQLYNNSSILINRFNIIFYMLIFINNLR